MKFLSLISVSLVSIQALPAQTPPPVQLPDVRVQGEQEKSLTVPTAARALEETRKTPGGANVVSAKEIRAGRASTMKDALEYSPGVFVQSRFGAEEARLSIRGSGLQRTFHGRGIKLLQDGVPLNLADGSFDFQAVEPLAVDYIEVYRGANALRHGSASLGGSINYVTPSGHNADRLRVRGEYGSYDYARAQISSGFAAGPVDYYLSVSEFYQSGFRDHAEQHTQRFFSNAGWQARETVETRFYFTYVDSQSELPGNLTKTQMRDDPRQANAGNIALDQQRNFDLARVANKTTWREGDQRVEVASWYFHKNLDHPIFQMLEQNSDDLGADIRYTHTAPWFNRQNELTLGFNPTYGILEDDRFLNIGGSRGARRGNSTQTSLNLDFYLENQHHLTDDFIFIAGVQLSQSQRKFEDRFLTDGDQTETENYTGFGPKLGFLYKLTPDTELYANVSRSYEPPTFGELVRPPGPGAVNGLVELDEQTATTFELGTRGNQGRLGWDLSYYYAWIEDELLSFEVPSAPGSFATVNADRTTHQGVELGGSLLLWEGLAAREGIQDKITLRQSYLWNDFRFSDDDTFGNNQLPGIPEHILRTELIYEHPSGFYGGPNLEWTPVDSFVDMANTLETDAYALVGIKIGYRATHRVSGFIEVRNVTDENYAATTGVITRQTGANGAQFSPGDGRAFYAGLEWKW